MPALGMKTEKPEAASKKMNEGKIDRASTNKSACERRGRLHTRQGKTRNRSLSTDSPTSNCRFGLSISAAAEKYPLLIQPPRYFGDSFSSLRYSTTRELWSYHAHNPNSNPNRHCPMVEFRSLLRATNFAINIRFLVFLNNYFPTFFNMCFLLPQRENQLEMLESLFKAK